MTNERMTNTQSTNEILMIKPINFGFNEETAVSNAFQNRNAEKNGVQEKALAEFSGMVEILRQNGVNVTVIEDTPQPYTPDSIFPNNWISFHNDGNIFLYPMQAVNRRLERRKDIIEEIEPNFAAKQIVDLSKFEAENKFLEGTGSMVLDRENKIAYACLSPRTDADILELFCKQTSFKPVCFDAVDANGTAIYHTNVLMCVGSKFVVICLDSITKANEKQIVINSIKSTGKEIIEISFDQMNHFAGNMLEVKSKNGETLIVMSASAFNSLTTYQKTSLEKYGKLIYADISTIETNGGGSARCMMAEIHLPLKN
jgi:hypothetical protein